LADVAAVGLPLGQAIGRVGCLINGCNYGIPTTLPWGVIWTNPGAMAPINDVARHPAQAYEALLSLAVFGLVWLLRKRFKTDGLLFLVYVVAYSLGRFPISLVREDTIALFGLRQAQVVGLALTLLALPVAYYLTRRSAVRLVAEEGLQKP
jgi:phosphatidylglycerol:prolipoprotein diacylglycerol transferase